MKKRVKGFLFSISFCRSLYFLLSIVLLGVFIGSLCVRFMGEASFAELATSLNYEKSDSDILWIDVFVKEFLLLFAVFLFRYIPYGFIGIFSVILYKGFSVGIVSGAYAFVFGAQGIKMIVKYLLVPNVFYLYSLCFLSDQMLRFSLNNGQTVSSLHIKNMHTPKTVYCFIYCAVITSIGIAIEMMLT